MNLKTAARWVALAPLFVIPFLALYVSDSLYFPFITGKGFAFRILVEIAFAGYVALAILDKKYRPRFSWTLALYGALVVWMAVADAFAVSPLKAFWSNFERMDGFVTLIHLFAFFVVLGAMLTADKLWKHWWLTFLASSAFVSLYGLFQLTGVLAIHQGGVRLDATLGNAEYLAGYLLFALAITLWQAIESKGWMRYALSALAVLHLVILYYTATRGALLALVGAVILGGILWMAESGKKGRQYAGGLIAVVLVLVGGFYLARHSSFVEHSPTLARFSDISLADGQTRFTIWHMAWEGALARPVTGWGQEGFNYIFNTYYEPSMYGQEPWFDRAHNLFFDWLTAGGFPALLLFLALLISAVAALYRGAASRAERVMLVSVLAAYAFQGLFVFDNLFTYIPLAALLAAAHAARMKPIRAIEDVPEPRDEGVVMTTGAVALVACALVVWFVNVPNIATAQGIIKALSSPTAAAGLDGFKAAIANGSFANQEIREQLATYASGVAQSSTISNDDKAAVVTYAVEQMKQEVAERPKDARAILEYALTYRAAGDLKDAYTQTTAALALSPKKQQILSEAGIEAWQLGDLAAAKGYFDKAYALSPNADDIVTQEAVGDIITGDVPGAKALLNQHFSTTTVDSDLLVYAYYAAKDYGDIVTILTARLSNTPSADNAYRLASAYVVAGRPDLAVTLIKATMTQYPASASAGQQLLTALGVK